ncbi:MAG: succinate dehydrogenase, hydrophobic membrane anchor protein [Pseudomonadota bacterium]
MSQSLRTPASQVRGLGAAREGTDHYIKQRVTAIALIFLVPWFIGSALIAAKGGYNSVIEWMAHPLNAVLLILLLGAAFYHMRLGMQVVVEDYIAKVSSRQALLILNTFVVTGLFVATSLSVLKVWFATG